MLHLTYTGPYAGQLLCGKRKADTPPEDTFVHFQLASDELIASHANICPTCQHMGLCKLDQCDICDNAVVYETKFTR